MTVNQAKTVNANANTKMGTFKVTAGKGFRFGGAKTASAKEVAFA